jgi:DNA polymerase III delta subunit
VRHFVRYRILGIDEETSQTNIALLQQYGANSWRVHNYLLEATSKQLEKAVEDLTQLTTDLNRDRKNSQVCSLFFRRDKLGFTDG